MAWKRTAFSASFRRLTCHRCAPRTPLCQQRGGPNPYSCGFLPSCPAPPHSHCIIHTAFHAKPSEREAWHAVRFMQTSTLSPSRLLAELGLSCLEPGISKPWAFEDDAGQEDRGRERDFVSVWLDAHMISERVVAPFATSDNVDERSLASSLASLRSYLIISTTWLRRSLQYFVVP